MDSTSVSTELGRQGARGALSSLRPGRARPWEKVSTAGNRGAFLKAWTCLLVSGLKGHWARPFPAPGRQRSAQEHLSGVITGGMTSDTFSSITQGSLRACGGGAARAQRHKVSSVGSVIPAAAPASCRGQLRAPGQTLPPRTCCGPGKSTGVLTQREAGARALGAGSGARASHPASVKRRRWAAGKAEAAGGGQGHSGQVAMSRGTEALLSGSLLLLGEAGNK